jgi:Asp-tRNA(Asn)/Glu-tRNA(Gln) amidotransferase A subunit family amidase
MSASGGQNYDPTSFEALSFHDALPAFRTGSDTPRAYLERCVETIQAREPVVQAFAHLNIEGARKAADESAQRWSAGAPRSLIDGMPVGIKDLLETRDMPTQMGCKAYQGHFPKRDNAAVRALREAGAVVFGKTVTAELGNAEPGPTTNPFNRAHTPGGSSSGSAAAVAARMLPAAIGTHVGGSIIRPASYCGNVAIKPSQGAINRGERQTTSMSTHGVHAGCIEDMWRVAIEIANRVGGDPGKAALCGPRTAPQARQPERLIVIESQGWSRIDDQTRGAFEQVVERVGGQQVQIVRRADDRTVEAFEQAIADAEELCSAITSWENHFSYRYLLQDDPHGVSQRMQATLARAEAMTVADYQDRLREREQAQLRFAQTRQAGDAMLMLSSAGAAPPWSGDKDGEPLVARPTGDAVFNCPSSMLFASAVTVPLMAIDGLPAGVQLVAWPGEDAAVTAFAQWMLQAVSPVSV